MKILPGNLGVARSVWIKHMKQRWQPYLFRPIFTPKEIIQKRSRVQRICTEGPFTAFNYQVGEGESTHLGHFTTQM